MSECTSVCDWIYPHVGRIVITTNNKNYCNNNNNNNKTQKAIHQDNRILELYLRTETNQSPTTVGPHLSVCFCEWTLNIPDAGCCTHIHTPHTYTLYLYGNMRSYVLLFSSPHFLFVVVVSYLCPWGDFRCRSDCWLAVYSDCFPDTEMERTFCFPSFRLHLYLFMTLPSHRINKYLNVSSKLFDIIFNL